jgi:hypothetical protein
MHAEKLLHKIIGKSCQIDKRIKVMGSSLDNGQRKVAYRVDTLSVVQTLPQ